MKEIKKKRKEIIKLAGNFLLAVSGGCAALYFFIGIL
jgi:hypothetical protein